MFIQKTLALRNPVAAVHINSYSIKKFYILSSQNKQRLFPYTSSTLWFFIIKVEFSCCAEQTESLSEINFNLSVGNAIIL